MKKLIPIISALLLLLSLPAMAEEPVLNNVADGLACTLTVNTIPVTEGLTYNDIMYIPLTERNQALLGITVAETKHMISIYTLPDDGTYYEVTDAEDQPDGVITAETKTVSLNGILYQDAAEYPYVRPAEYPFIRRDEIIYMPLTWGNVTTMGWITEYSSETGMNLYANSRFQTHHQEGEWMSGWHSESSYYLVRGINCAKVVHWAQRFFSGIDLFYGRIGNLTKYDNKFFPFFSEENMEIKGNSLFVNGLYYENIYGEPYRPDHFGGTPSEIYRLEIGMTTDELKDTVLIKKNVYNTLYGEYGDEEGNVSNEGIFYETTPTGGNSIFRYQGGHVILNGSMMRSYNSLIYKAHSWNEDGTPQSFGASTDEPFWICVEDLANYGFDMVVDYENRATYFTRNPQKEIIPSDFDGTNEAIPIYPSDWKIFIDGVEPQRCFNIGGYTMINSGELGEYTDVKLEDGYDIRYVLTPDMVIPETKVIHYYVGTDSVAELPYESLTDVAYTLVAVSGDGTLTVHNPEVLKELKEKADEAGVRVSLTVKGAVLNTIAADPALTHRFIENCVWTLREYGLDGIVVNGSDADVGELYNLISTDKRLRNVSRSR